MINSDDFSDIEMMKNYMSWPNMVLPLTRIGEVGVLNGGGPTVYLVNMFNIPDKIWDEIPHLEYESFEDLVDDGWRVD